MPEHEPGAHTSCEERRDGTHAVTVPRWRCGGEAASGGKSTSAVVEDLPEISGSFWHETGRITVAGRP